jgi:hypothetical protein
MPIQAAFVTKPWVLASWNRTDVGSFMFVFVFPSGHEKVYMRSKTVVRSYRKAGSVKNSRCSEQSGTWHLTDFLTWTSLASDEPFGIAVFTVLISISANRSKGSCALMELVNYLSGVPGLATGVVSE